MSCSRLSSSLSASLSKDAATCCVCHRLCWFDGWKSEGQHVRKNLCTRNPECCFTALQWLTLWSWSITAQMEHSLSEFAFRRMTVVCGKWTCFNLVVWSFDSCLLFSLRSTCATDRVPSVVFSWPFDGYLIETWLTDWPSLLRGLWAQALTGRSISLSSPPLWLSIIILVRVEPAPSFLVWHMVTFQISSGADRVGWHNLLILAPL